MIKINDKTKCCGCTACFNACPVNAIAMIPDNEGFLYPYVDQKKCVNCRTCENACPIFNKNDHAEKTDGYIVRYSDDKVVEESTSGGAFTAFASYLLNQGYIVYGASFDNNMKVVCKMTTSLAGLSEMRGSKFVQSTLGSTFKDIKRRLKSEEKIVFTGTPCQVSGLISFLGEKPKNLFCIDFVCRGVPSPGLWENYVNMMEQRYGSKMVAARFKNKTYGYHATTMKVNFANGKTWYGSGRIDPMMKAFVRELASRPSCSKCAFKGIKRQSDITMFDCYKFSSITKLKDDNKGYSSLFIHSEQGRQVFDKIVDRLIVYPVAVDTLVAKNGVMVMNSAQPNPKRDQFYKIVAQYPIDKAMSIIDPITKRDFIIERTKRLLAKIQLIYIFKKLKRERIKI